MSSTIKPNRSDLIPQGTDSGIIYKSGNVMSASSYVTLSSTTDPSSATSSVIIYSKNYAGRDVPFNINSYGRKTMMDFHHSFARNQIIVPAGFNTTSFNANGLVNFSAVGTPTARNPSLTNFLSSTRRIGYISATSAGSSTSVRTTTYYIYNTGLYINIKFAASRTFSDSIFFVGLHNNSSSLGSSDSSTTSFPKVGLVKDAADNTFYFVHNSFGVTPTKINTGLSIDNTIVYNLKIFIEPNANTIYLFLENVENGNLLSNAVLSSNLPDNATSLYFHLHIYNNATASSVAVEFLELSAEVIK